MKQENPAQISFDLLQLAKGELAGLAEEKSVADALFIGGSVARLEAAARHDIDIIVWPPQNNRHLTDQIFDKVSEICRQSPHAQILEVRTGPFPDEVLVPFSSLSSWQPPEVPPRFLVEEDGQLREF